MKITQKNRMDGYGRPFVITIPAFANTPMDDLLRNAEDAVRRFRGRSQIGVRISVGYAGEPGASAPSIFLTGDVKANQELYGDSGAAMNELVKIATETSKYLPAHLPTDKKFSNSVRIQYDEQDVYLGREIEKVEA